MSGIYIPAEPFGYIYLDDLGHVRIEMSKNPKSEGVFDLEWKIELVLAMSEGDVFNPSGSAWEIYFDAGWLRFRMVEHNDNWGGPYSLWIPKEDLRLVYETMREKIEAGRERLSYQMMQAECI